MLETDAAEALRRTHTHLVFSFFYSRGFLHVLGAARRAFAERGDVLPEEEIAGTAIVGLS